MKDYTSFLGICIPVYNNLKYLQINLKLLYRLFEYNDMEPLKIFISDNASEDGLKEAIDDLKKQYPTIIYQYNAKNEGLSANLAKVLQMADTTYAWLLGVDDGIKGDIAYILKALEEDPDFLALSETNDIPAGLYNDTREIFLKLAYESNWISGDIFKRTLVDQLDFAKYLNTMWVHTFALLDHNEKTPLKYCLLHNQSVFHLNGNNISWNDNFLRAMCYEWADFIMSFANYTYPEKLGVLRLGGKRAGRMSNLWLLSLRAQGKYDYRFYKDNYEYIHLYNPAGGGLLVLIAIAPKGLLKLARSLYLKLEKLKNRNISR